MTWTAQCTVESVSDTSPLEIRATAASNELVSMPYSSTGVPSITSSTEGEIVGCDVTLRLAGVQSPFNPGDRIQVTGHFNALPEDVTPPAAPVGSQAPEDGQVVQTDEGSTPA